MNIVVIHKEITSVNDIVQSPRFEPWQIDQAVNWAIKNIIKNRYEKAKMEENGKNAPALLRLRDEFYTIVQKKTSTDGDSPLVITNDVITAASFPTRYLYLLALKFRINNLQEDYASFITYPEFPVLQKNPFRRPSKVYPYKFYYALSSLGAELLYNKNIADSATYAEMYFLNNPVEVNYGTTITPSTPAFPDNKSCIAQVDGTTVGATVYKEGDEFTLIAGAQLSAGSASISFVNTDIPEILHTEIVQEAAKWLELKVKDFDKWQAMEKKEQLDKM
jgi:hypothetical protein